MRWIEGNHQKAKWPLAPVMNVIIVNLTKFNEYRTLENAQQRKNQPSTLIPEMLAKQMDKH